MTREEKKECLLKELQRRYPKTETFLHFQSDWQLLFAIILSAQATDLSVNKATEKLFARFPSLSDYTEENQKEILALISNVGLGKSKSRYLIDTAEILLRDYQGKVVKDRKLLQELPGVGFKTSGVFLGEYYNMPYFPVDTHVFRLSHRLGIVKESLSPEKTEIALEHYFGKDASIHLHRQFILFGRNVCTAKSPDCSSCPFSSFCSYYKKQNA